MNITQLTENTITRLRCQRIAPLLVPYADDRLRRVDRERVEAHLENCPACRAEVKMIAGVGALLRDEALSNASPVAADLSPNLWAGIEAEIRRSGVPLDRSAESPLLRPRRRVGLGWDAAWPSSVPVAAAVFSAVVFGTVLLNHHALTTRISSTASGITQDDAVTVAMRPSASVPGLASAGAAVSPPNASLFFARAKAAAPAAHRAGAGSAHRPAPTAGESELIAAAVAARPTIARNPAVTKSRPTTDLAAVTLRDAAPATSLAPASSAAPLTALVAARNVSAPTGETANVSAPASLPGVPYGVDAVPSGEASARDMSAAAAAPKIADTAVTTSVPAGDSPTSVSASKPVDDDATVRSGAPADQPMADFAVMSRRQRSLFSYTSR